MNEVINKILDQSISYEEADFLTNIFGMFRQDAISGNIPVVLFGAGSAGKELYPLLKHHGVNPVCFCDNNPKRVGTLCCGMPVISPDELSEAHKDSLIVVMTARYAREIKKQLIDQGIISDRILCIDEGSLTRFYSHISLSHWTVADLKANEKNLQMSYNLLHDEKSKQFFIKYLALLTNGSDYRSFWEFIRHFSETERYSDNPTESYLYFNTNIIDLHDDEILVDCGAYNGDSSVEFIKACQKHNVSYKYIYCFEPEPTLFQELSQNMATYLNTKAINSGLWTHSTTLTFVDTTIERAGATRIIRENGDIHFSDRKIANSKVRVTSIDEEFPNDKITFIKMDIEGAELEAIHGAVNVIGRWAPKLAISVYHKRNDIFEIPLLLHQVYPRYKFYLRQFSKALAETVLYAIP